MTEYKPMTKKNIFIIIALFLLLLTSFRFFWINYHSTPDYKTAEKGVIDLSEWEFTDKETLKLDGEWKFYPNQFLDPSGNSDTGNKTTVSVPGNWQEEKTEKFILLSQISYIYANVYPPIDWEK